MTGCTSREDVFLEEIAGDTDRIEGTENAKATGSTGEKQTDPGELDNPVSGDDVPLMTQIPQTIFVDVCGAVANPGVYELDEGSRIFQAVDAAGGYLPEAAQNYLNRARSLTDGQQIYVPTEEEIAENLPVETQIMSIEDAKKSGAMALFGEKYGDSVRVVSMGDFSKEFCGGTHVKNTSEIAAFKIISENGVAAGVRRIEALTGDNVFAYYRNLEKELLEAAKAAKATPATLTEKIEHMQAEIKALTSENESLKSKAAKEALGDVMDQIVEVKGVKLLASAVDGVDMNGLRDLGDQLKEQLGEGVIVLASSCEGKVNLIVMATDAAMKQGAHAGNLIKSIAGKVGGGGGGRPNMAQAGGKNPAGILEAIAEAKTALEAQLS